MPLLDVSDALEDALLLDMFSVLRRAETINSNGESTLTTVQFTDLPGVVHAESGNDLEQTEITRTQNKAIAVLTKFALRGASVLNGQSFQPDIVQWNGNSFLVNKLEDYGLYGMGYIRAVCSIFDVQSTPPQTGVIMLSLAGKLQLFQPVINSPTQVTLLNYIILAQNMIVLRNGLPQFSPGDYTAAPDNNGNTILTLVLPLSSMDSIAIYV